MARDLLQNYTKSAIGGDSTLTEDRVGIDVISGACVDQFTDSDLKMRKNPVNRVRRKRRNTPYTSVSCLEYDFESYQVTIRYH
jgi:hypothetical protein